MLLFVDVAGKQEKHEVNDDSRLGELLTRLKQAASDEGFTIVDNEGSGNCMFHALADQLKLMKGLDHSHLQVRQSIVEFLKNNPEWVSNKYVIGLVYCHLLHVKAAARKNFKEPTRTKAVKLGAQHVKC